MYDPIIPQVISYTINQNSYFKCNQLNWKLSARNLLNQLLKLLTIYAYLRL